MSVLNKNISYFPSATATKKGVEVNLLQLLQTERHKNNIMALRAETDSTKQKEIKNQLPCYTVSGIFSRRCESGLIQASGLASVDLDSAEDYNTFDLMQELKKIPYIAYIGQSCRGKRLFCIVPFLYPDKYVKQYERLIQSFEDIGLPMGDSCHKQISQPRFVSYNTADTCFFRHDAKPYHLIAHEKTYHLPTVSRTFNTKPENAFLWCENQINKKITFAPGNRHEYIKQLARYCNLKGISEHETLNGCLSYQQQDFNEKEIQSIVKHIYKNQIDSYNKYPFQNN